MKISETIFFISIFFIGLVNACTNTNTQNSATISVQEKLELNCNNISGKWLLGYEINGNLQPTGQTIIIDSFCSYSFKLEVNSCGGGIEILPNDSIQFSNYTCTEMCCDSEYSEHNVAMLTLMNHVSEIKSDTILLEAKLDSITIKRLEGLNLKPKTKMLFIRQKSN